MKRHEPSSAPRRGAAKLARKPTGHQACGHPPLVSVPGLLPDISPFTHPTDARALRSEVSKRSPTQKHGLTAHLAASGHSLDVLRA